MSSASSQSPTVQGPALRVGLYGGTFDPIHFGHLNLALELMERRGLDEVWFCPARISPHRLDREPRPAHHRLAMVKLAIEPIQRFKVIDIELQREGPSYTIDTVHSLLTVQPDLELFLLMSDEAARGLAGWKEAEQIIALAPPLVGIRLGLAAEKGSTGSSAIDAAIEGGLTPMPALDISASQIRQRLKENRYCGHLVPSNSLSYAIQYGLYGATV
jgi:nicotinate-nucleotide adenylyltransferase